MNSFGSHYWQSLIGISILDVMRIASVQIARMSVRHGVHFLSKSQRDRSGRAQRH